MAKADKQPEFRYELANRIELSACRDNLTIEQVFHELVIEMRYTAMMFGIDFEREVVRARADFTKEIWDDSAELHEKLSATTKLLNPDRCPSEEEAANTCTTVAESYELLKLRRHLKYQDEKRRNRGTVPPPSTYRGDAKPDRAGS